MDEVERLKKLVDELEQQLSSVLSTQQILQTFILASLNNGSKSGGGGKNELRCSFCGKSQSQTAKLIAGPGVYICDDCVDLCQEILDEEFHVELVMQDVPVANDSSDESSSSSEANLSPDVTSDHNESWQCSFCGKPKAKVKKLITGPGVNICSECVPLCQEVLEEEMPRDKEDDELTISKRSGSQSKSRPRCSFCGKVEDKRCDFVAGPGVNICKDCVSLCNEVLGDKAAQTKANASE